MRCARCIGGVYVRMSDGPCCLSCGHDPQQERDRAVSEALLATETRRQVVLGGSPQAMERLRATERRHREKLRLERASTTCDVCTKSITDGWHLHFCDAVWDARRGIWREAVEA